MPMTTLSTTQNVLVLRLVGTHYQRTMTSSQKQKRIQKRALHVV